MLRTLKALFEDSIASFAERDDPSDALPLAVAALLVEISKADSRVDSEERRAIVDALLEVCNIGDDDLAALLDTADDAVDEAVSFYDFTSVVNEHLSHDKKYELLVMLWRIAYADGRIDHYEEYYIRRLSDLLHLSHREFIRAKLEAAD